MDAGPDDPAVRAAAEIVRAGGLVAFPTETVYGLGADATSDRAVARIYAAKGRPAFNPLIAHVTGLEAARVQGRFDARAERLAETFWPGPLTLVVPRAATCTVSAIATVGLPSVALRAPSHRVARALIAASGRPIVAPSANVSGHVSATEAGHVIADLDGSVDLVLDAGASPVGVESTIVACLEGEPVRLLRPGGVPREAIEAIVGPVETAAEATGAASDAAAAPGDAAGAAPLAPGMLASHYAPRASVRLDALAARADEAVLAFAGVPKGGAVRLDLSPEGDLAEAAAHLFAHLRALDATGAVSIAVGPIPAEGLGLAIRDRLARAAAPRG